MTGPAETGLCECADTDPDLVRMLDLMAAGYTQQAASRIVWAPLAAVAAELEALDEFARAWGQVADVILLPRVAGRPGRVIAA